ncbi:hypothetical protein CYG49_03085 [Candidatus Saccharibacteria bacterium]|nr:MAG: hypothetical protein CYG49_03085 [Candidatus Saccharibacteria bacterium]
MAITPYYSDSLSSNVRAKDQTIMIETKLLADRLLRRPKLQGRAKEVFEELRKTPDEAVDLWLEVVTPPEEQSFLHYRSQIFANADLFPEYFPTFAQEGVNPQVLLFDLMGKQRNDISHQSKSSALIFAKTKEILNQAFGDALSELRQDWRRHYFLPVCNTVDERGELILIYNADAEIEFTGKLIETHLPGMIGTIIVPEMIACAIPEPLPGEESVVRLKLPDIDNPDPALVAQHIVAADEARQHVRVNPHIKAAARRRMTTQDSIAIPPLAA